MVISAVPAVLAISAIPAIPAVITCQAPAEIVYSHCTNKTLRGCIGFDWRVSDHQLQVKRQLVKLAKFTTAKKEDDFVLDEAEFALAA